MCHQTVNISTVFMASRIDAAVKVVGYIKKKQIQSDHTVLNSLLHFSYTILTSSKTVS